ncbi:MAG: hypothetical protein AB7V43_16690 [Acidimicrobiia bacterium]
MSSNVRALRPAESGRTRSARLQVLEFRRRRRRTGLAALALIAVVFGVLFALAGVQAYLVQRQGQLDRINTQIAAREERLDRLRLKVAELTSPEHITARASSLGMTEPEQVTYLRPGGNVVVEVQNNGLATGARVDVPSIATGDAWPTVKRVERSTP